MSSFRSIAQQHIAGESGCSPRWESHFKTHSTHLLAPSILTNSSALNSDFSGKAESLVWARKGHWQLHYMTKCITTLLQPRASCASWGLKFQQKLSNRAGNAGTEPFRPEISSKCKQFEGRSFQRKLKLNNSHATFQPTCSSRRVQHMLRVYSHKIWTCFILTWSQFVSPIFVSTASNSTFMLPLQRCLRPFGCTWATRGRRKNKLRFSAEQQGAVITVLQIYFKRIMHVIYLNNSIHIIRIWTCIWHHPLSSAPNPPGTGMPENCDWQLLVSLHPWHRD